MSVRRLFSLMHGLGYQSGTGASSRMPEPRSEEPRSPQSGLAKLIAMRPKDMNIVYAPKKGVSDGG